MILFEIRRRRRDKTEDDLGTKLNFREKQYLDGIQIGSQALRSDWCRRLRNALVALADMDPAWMIWVEMHVPSTSELRTAARSVEVQARTLLMRGYRHYGESVIKEIVEGNRPFGDDGTLSL